jgi:two-component system nitrogen regulation response regulator GlnG
LNCGALPETLLESELFGHVKGAFTGAAINKKGLVEVAERGTLFLDEIGEMSPMMQVKLLRVLQERRFRRVGGTEELEAAMRVITATNQDLAKMVAEGRFREDLFYRINVINIHLPPLRERTEDIPDLVRHFLAQAEKEGLPSKHIEHDAMERLKRYRWPGNVRELENLVRRLAALYSQETITAAIIDTELADAEPAQAADGTTAPETLSEYVERHLLDYFAEFGDVLPPPGLYNRVLRDIERPLIAVTLAATAGNQIRTSDLLGINRNTLRKKIRELEIKVIRGAR